VTVSDSIFHNLAMCFRGFDNSSSFVVSDTDMACDFGLKRQMFTSGSNGSNPIADQVFLLENVTWEGISGTPIGITGHTSTTDVLVYMHWCASTANADGGNCDDDPFGTNEPDLAHTTTVTNANGNNLTFNVYFLEQEAEDVAGGVSPCSDDTSRPEIRGIACSIQAADVPTGAIGDYSFSEESGGSIPNTVVGQMAAMEISGSDFTTSADGIEWTNDEMYTHESPFDPADGTWADLASAFSEPFNAANAGTVAIRFKVSSTLQSGLGQASFIGLWSFRQNPELNYSAVGQAGMEIARGGPGAPLTIVARTGTVCEGNFNDQVQSGEIADLSEWHTAILVWDATTLRLWIDGVEDVTGNRDCGDWSTDDVQLQMAATSFVTHSDDRQYFTGTTSRFVVYDRELSDPELAELHAALSGDVVEPPPSGQRHRFRFRSSEE
jgi:hypothetical protein